MITLTVKHDIAKVNRQLGIFGRSVEQATARSLNEAINKGRTAMAKEIGATYNLKAAKIKERLKVRRAYASGRIRLSAELSGTGKRAMNVTAFDARQTKQGASVKIKRTGGRKVPRPAWATSKPFILPVAGRPVVAHFGKGRGQLRAISTIAVPQMFNQRRINAIVREVIERDFVTIYTRNARFYAARV